MSFELDEKNLPRLSDEDRESLDDYSVMPAAMDDDAIARRDRAQALSYAIAKQVPEIRRGAVFNTAYGDLTLDSEDSRRVADLVESLLRARLASDAAHARKKPTPTAADPSDQAENAGAEQLQTKVLMIRDIVQEQHQADEQTAAISLLLKGRFEDNADSDNDDVTLRLSFDALNQRIVDRQLHYMLRDRLDELAAMVGLEAEVSHA